MQPRFPIPPCLQAVAQGRVDRRQPFRGLKLARCSHAPNSRLEAHSHASFALVCILEGEVEELSYARTLTYRRGDVVVKPPGHVHANRFGRRGAETVYLEVTGAARVQLPEFSPLFRHEGQLTGRETSRIVDELERLFAVSKELEPPQLTERSQRLLVAASTVLRAPRETDGFWLDRLRNRLHDGYQHPLELRALSREFQLHPVYVARRFRERFGCTVGEYLRQLRISHALGLLMETDMPLREIALDAGFSDQPHFTRLFRRSTGLPPGAFRSQSRTGHSD